MLKTARERVEKLFNEGKSEADVIAARPLKISMPSGLRATTPRSPSPRWSTTPSSGRDGGTVAWWRPAPAQRSAVEVAKQYGLLARLSRWRWCGHAALSQRCAPVRRQPRDARRRRGMSNIASTGLVLGSSAVISADKNEAASTPQLGRLEGFESPTSAWGAGFHAFTQSMLLLARSLRRARFRDSNSRRSGIVDAPFSMRAFERTDATLPG
jgi:hypothetical protein